MNDAIHIVSLGDQVLGAYNSPELARYLASLCGGSVTGINVDHCPPQNPLSGLRFFTFSIDIGTESATMKWLDRLGSVPDIWKENYKKGSIIKGVQAAHNDAEAQEIIANALKMYKDGFIK